MDKITSEELLFYGAIEVNLAQHSGSVYQTKINSIDEKQFINRNSLLSFEYDKEQIIIPDLPADLIELQPLRDREQILPEEFCYPLIKTTVPSRLKGIVSGVRSALIKSKSSKWYRLKGCGDNTDGFTIKSISNSNKKLTIRGCAFSHTTYRELFMTHYISQLLSQYQIDCANTSIGWFEYKRQIDDQIQSDVPVIEDKHLDQWSNIIRCCILMETLGNKRLSDHLLFGIEQLFELIICDTQLHPVNQLNLISLFSAERLTKSEENNEQLVPLSTWFASLTNQLEPIDYKQTNWLDLSSHFSTKIPSDVIEDRWKTMWENQIENLNNYLLRQDDSLSNLLCLLYKRIGFECGSILGLMHYHRISWGTYTDELGVHCNAHPNNFVIKLPTLTSSFVLAPLDFDMSFTEKTYRTNQMNNQSFDEIIRLEVSGFELTLGGDSQASTGVTSWIDLTDYRWSNVRWLLRDIMLIEFQKTYDQTIQNGCINSMDFISNEQNDVLYSLIRLALIKTMNETG